MFTCVLGQWKVKFNPNNKKGYFTKFNGDVVTVPLLYHDKYMATMMYDPHLKAQVRNKPPTDTFHSNMYLNPTQTFLPQATEVTSCLHRFLQETCVLCFFNVELFIFNAHLNCSTNSQNIQFEQ